MKKVLFLFVTISFMLIACKNNSTKNAATKSSGALAGSCKKCTCPSFREDATEDACLNIQPPTQKLCGHKKTDHR